MLNDQFNIIIICGAKGTGKTTFAIELLSKSKRKTAIIDMLDHQSYRHIPIMPTTHLAAWKTGIYRLISSEPLSLLEEINNKVWDANLILEDAHRYLSQNMSKNEIRLFYESKQHGFDIVVMYHAVSQIPPDLYRISDKLVLFKTKDTFKSSTYNKFYNKTEIENAHAKVMRSKSPHAKNCNKPFNMEDKPVIKSYSKRELIDMYGTTYTTFYTWVKRAGIIDELKDYDNIRVFTPKEVELIFNKLGEPNN